MAKTVRDPLLSFAYKHVAGGRDSALLKRQLKSLSAVERRRLTQLAAMADEPGAFQELSVALQRLVTPEETPVAGEETSPLKSQRVRGLARKAEADMAAKVPGAANDPTQQARVGALVADESAKTAAALTDIENRTAQFLSGYSLPKSGLDNIKTWLGRSAKNLKTLSNDEVKSLLVASGGEEAKVAAALKSGVIKPDAIRETFSTIAKVYKDGLGAGQWKNAKGFLSAVGAKGTPSMLQQIEGAIGGLVAQVNVPATAAESEGVLAAVSKLAQTAVAGEGQAAAKGLLAKGVGALGSWPVAIGTAVGLPMAIDAWNENKPGGEREQRQKAALDSIPSARQIYEASLDSDAKQAQDMAIMESFPNAARLMASRAAGGGRGGSPRPAVAPSTGLIPGERMIGGAAPSGGMPDIDPQTLQMLSQLGMSGGGF